MLTNLGNFRTYPFWPFFGFGPFDHFQGHFDKGTEQTYSKGPRNVERVLSKHNLFSMFTACIPTLSNRGILPDIL